MTAASKLATPQQTARGFREAMISGNWELAFEYLTVEAQSGLVAGAYVSAAYVTASAVSMARDTLGQLAQKYGLSSSGLRAKGAPGKESSELIAMFCDLMEWSDEHLPSDQRGDFSNEYLRTQYSEFRIRENRAYAIATNGDRRSKVRFRLIGERWYRK